MIQNYNRYKILMKLFDRPTHNFQLRELSRMLRLGLPSVKAHVLGLEKEGFARKVKNGVFMSYAAARESDRFRLYKKVDLMLRLFESGLLAYLERELSYPSAIVLFGSCAYGEDTEKSDVDLAVIAGRRELELGKYEGVLRRRVQLHFFKDVTEMKKTPELFNNIINGVVLRGFVKVL